MSLTERVEADLAAGKPWKARQRLNGALTDRPTDQDLLEQLGEVCFSMGDLPAAGRYWFLTARTGSDVVAAYAAMHEEHPDPGSLLTVLPVRARAEAYPEAVAERLRTLVAETPENWFLRKKRLLLTGHAQGSTTLRPIDDWVGDVIVVVIVVVIVGVWLLGAGTAIYLLWKFVAWLFRARVLPAHQPRGPRALRSIRFGERAKEVARSRQKRRRRATQSSIACL